MRFTVLGKSPAWEDAGGACSGYLVEEGSYTLLVDCGNGAFGRLRERTSYAAVDEVLISHVHADHVLDLVPFGYALTVGSEVAGSSPPPLHLPPGGLEQLRALVAVWGSDELIDEAFAPAEYGVDAALKLGPLGVQLHQVPHFALTHAVELLAPSGRRLVYGADCRAGPELTEAARGADVLLAEATLAEAEGPAVPLQRRGHMSAAEAGEVAGRAGVERLVLTHISDELDPGAAIASASAGFAGRVEIAAPGSSWEL